MSIIITGAIGITRRLSKLEAVIARSPKEIVKIVSEARNKITKRTNKGLDAMGNSFTPLNDMYAIYKTGRGKRGIPDLHYEGHMLRAMQVKSIKNGAEIYFNNETERKKAVAHNFGNIHLGRNLPRRNFFRLGDKIEKYIFNQFRKPIKRIL